MSGTLQIISSGDALDEWGVPGDAVYDDDFLAYFESLSPDDDLPDVHAPVSLAVGEFDGLRSLLSATPVSDRESAGELLARLGAVEKLRRALDWYAGELMVAVDAQRRIEDHAAEVPERRVGSTVAAEVALVRRVSPAKAARDLGLAKVARTELPHAWDGLRRGEVTSTVVRRVAAATAMLDLDDRVAVDEALAEDDLGTLSEKAVDALARRRAYEADPRAFVAARGRAESDRYVTWRAMPDVMMQVTALLPLAQGVAVAAALTKAAEQARAGGDERTRAQVLADTLVQRATGHNEASVVPVAVNLVLDASTLLARDGGTNTATITAPGLTPEPVPGPVALDLLGRALDEDPDLELRRLFTQPDTGDLIAMESRSRFFPMQLREFVRLRDGVCRTPWCGAPIRHIDHITPADQGGPTSAANAAGRCERCNHVKQHPDWHETTDPTGRLRISTPSGLRT